VTVVQVPTTATSVVFRTTFDGRSDLLVIGPRTRGRYLEPKNMPVCVRVGLPVGAASRLFGQPVRDLVDQSLPLEELWGPAAAELTASLGSRPTPSMLATSLGLGTRRPTALAVAMRELAEPDARLSIVADRIGLSERYLRALFAREVGLSPKQFARVSRVRRVLAGAGRERWAALAEEAGFFDQAHMIADFRSVMGVTPAAFLAGKRPAVTPCQGPS
jgi:AraC-like DNA-binding protein